MYFFFLLFITLLQEHPESGAGCRFSDVTDDDIDQLIKDGENKNTQKSTKWAVRVFEEWRKTKMNRGQVIPELKDFSVGDVNDLLGKFVIEVRKKDGDKYPPNTLYLLVCGLLREMRSIGINNMNFLNDSDDRFLRFRKILDAQMKSLTADGYGVNVKQADPITEEQEEILWNSGVFGDRSSETLLYTVFFYNSKFFGLRGRDEHRNLQIKQVQIGKDDNGTFIKFRGKTCKTYNGGLRHRYIEPKVVKHYLTEDCPILVCYNTYINAVKGDKTDDSAPFYRRPVQSDKGHKFDNVLGANKLSSLMKVICEKGGIKGNFTNHSGKRTMATRLFQAGICEQMIMDRSGHRSEKGVRRYKRPSEEMLKDVSNILNPNVKKMAAKKTCIDVKKPETVTKRCISDKENVIVNIGQDENSSLSSLGNNCTNSGKSETVNGPSGTFKDCVFNLYMKD